MAAYPLLPMNGVLDFPSLPLEPAAAGGRPPCGQNGRPRQPVSARTAEPDGKKDQLTGGPA